MHFEVNNVSPILDPLIEERTIFCSINW